MDFGRAFWEKIMTVDVTWVFKYDPETKRQSLQWMEASMVSKTDKSAHVKIEGQSTMLIFFDTNGIGRYEFVPPQVSQAFCVQVLERLRQRIRRKRPSLCPNKWT